MKINLVGWSFDRAAQLELLLRSINTFISDIFDISIIYNYSSNFFGDGYRKLISEYKNVLWIKEFPNQFESHTKFAISQCRSDFISLTTDDCVFFRNVDRVSLNDALPKLKNQVFSFRLGENCVIQNIHTGQVQPPLNIKTNHGKWLSWPINCYNPQDNYGYPYGLDLHVFRRELLVPILEDMEFRSTNDIESKLTMNYRHLVDELRSFDESVAVNVPINSVTNVTRSGELHPISKEELNRRFLDGELIDLDDIVNTKVTGCHMEIPLKLH